MKVVGTCHTNWKGWPKEAMNLTQKDDCSSMKVMYDNVNRVHCLQWVDSKPVNMVDMFGFNSTCEVMQWKGSQELTINGDTMTQFYNKKMFGVNKEDQHRKYGGVSVSRLTSRSGTRRFT